MSLGRKQLVAQCVCACVSAPNVQAYGPPVTAEMPLMPHGPESL